MAEHVSFEEFFTAAWGTPPFGWQTRLAHQVLADGRWPDVLDIPTGAGKTAALDVAVYALAMDPQRFARRVVFVVDRRIVVDQVVDRARALADSLAGAADGPLAEIAGCLRALMGDVGGDAPLAVASLRGGTARVDDTWAAWPHQPTVIAATVDQVGSRLLFSGYGVSDRMAPVHAGLMGNDTLVLLDEVQISVPFARTLAVVQRRRASATEPVAGRPWQAVRMSATPDDADGERFSLLDDDLRGPGGEELDRRLRAAKPGRCVEVAVKRQQTPRDALAAAAAEHVARLRSDGLRGVIGVVVNRVATARAVAEVLRADEGDVVLLTGRMRPLDREEQVARAQHLASADRPDGTVHDAVVVATQTIEVGADLSFDALITEVCPLSALRQRCGRLDRRGRRAAAGAPAPVVVLATTDQVGAKADDPIYGSALAATWSALRRLGDMFDAGPRSAELAALADDPTLRAAVPDEPLLLPTHLDLLSHTNPRSSVRPDVEPFLHGFIDTDPEIRVVWRRAEPASIATDVLRLCPPRTGEALDVPLSVARRWLAKRLAPVHGDAPPDVDDLTDVDGRSPRAEDEPVPSGTVLVWRGADDVSVRSLAELRPGDTVVVPTTTGGLSAGCWAPESNEEVDDLGDIAQVDAGSRQVIRLPLDADEPGDVPDGWVAVPLGEERVRWVLVGPAVRSTRLSLDGSDETNSLIGVVVDLADHLNGVARYAERFGRSCGLPESVVHDIVLAGAVHDLGKIDPRFQAWMRGGDPLAARLDRRVVAKGVTAASRTKRARVASGYPEGMRHEHLSAVLVQDHDILRTANDPDLVVHLVLSHHGGARPLPVTVADDAPCAVMWEHLGATFEGTTDVAKVLDPVESAERFWRLTRRYGWWGLGWLEAVLRLADHRRSQAETDGSAMREEAG